MASKNVQVNFFILLLTLAFFLAFMMFLPYIQGLLTAAALATVFQPLYRRMMRAFGGQRVASAAMCVFVVLALVLTPLVFFGVQIAKEATDLYTYLAANGQEYPGGFEALLGSEISKFFPAFSQSFSLDKEIRQAVELLLSNIGSLFSGTLKLFVNLFVGLIAFYYLLKDGTRFREIIIKLSPLPDEYDRDVLEHLGRAVNSVIKGTLVIALIQGVLTSVGFMLFNVPNPALWGGVAAVAALVPGIGTSLVLAPAIFYLLVIGETGLGLGLFLWGVTAVGLIDQFLGPKLIERGTNIHPLFIVLAVLGGISFFGPMGFLIGPLILSFLFSLLKIYQSFILGQPDSSAI
jgi:predicted PurR-regulated permease PerM